MVWVELKLSAVYHYCTLVYYSASVQQRHGLWHLKVIGPSITPVFQEDACTPGVLYPHQIGVLASKPSS